jgi:hypothetical protein
MKTTLLAVVFVAVALPAFAASNDYYPIIVTCDRGYDRHEVVKIKLDDKNVLVELHGRNETINDIMAKKTFSIYRVTGKVSKTGNDARSSTIALGQQLPPGNEQSWTVYFGDQGQNSLAMALTSYSSSFDKEIHYSWKGQLNMQPGVKDVCYIDGRD